MSRNVGQKLMDEYLRPSSRKKRKLYDGPYSIIDSGLLSFCDTLYSRGTKGPSLIVVAQSQCPNVAFLASKKVPRIHLLNR